MSIANEAVDHTGLQTALKTGIENLSRDQAITFTKYTRTVLPLDGYVFWVAGTDTITTKGSLHVGVERHQDQDQTIGVNSVIFTAESQVTEFNDIQPGTMWIASIPAPGGQAIEVAFSRRGPFYQAANLFHYAGFAVYPPLKSQIVASAADLPTDPIVNNSLPVWLALTQYAPVFPSFLVDENIVPPYVSVHIEPDLTKPIQSFMKYNWSTTDPEPGKPGFYYESTDQLAQDHVVLTLYGFTNQTSLQYLSYLLQYSLSSDAVGFMTPVVPKDDKRTQTEIAAIAMKKTIEFDCSYYQSTTAVIAERMIESATMAIQTSGVING